MYIKTYSAIIDDFFDEPLRLRNHALAQSFEGITNPFDNVFYPDISLDVPEDFVDELVAKLEGLVGVGIEPTATFFRLSKAGTYAPHQAHTDTVMARYTALVYLNKPEDCIGGTSILEHRYSDLKRNPENEEGVEIWKRDMNDAEAWKVVQSCPMMFNRCFLMDSDLFHRSEPIGGFGDDNETGRLVLVCFFN